jgi:hypothetical protein
VRTGGSHTNDLYLLRQTEVIGVSGGRLVVQITVLGNFHVIENDRVLVLEILPSMKKMTHLWHVVVASA